MRRKCCLALLLANLAVCVLLGCGQQAPPAKENAPPLVVAANPGIKNQPEAAPAFVKRDEQPLPGKLGAFPANAEARRKYEATLLEALGLIGEKKLPDALASLESAAKIWDTELVQNEIKKLRARIEQQQAADQTTQDIQLILDQGKALDAGKLATAALEQYGSTDAAPALVKLKLQADALMAGQFQDNTAQLTALKDQAQAALAAGNLRGEAIALEQALQLGEDAVMRQRFDEIRTKLAKYDDNRQKAAELRKDLNNLEDAIDLLKDAATAWDTPQIRQDIDELTVALQNRRDRLAVADFEVRGDVGIPLAERVLAEELLPRFKGQFDLVERGQIAKLMEELKLDADQLGVDENQRQVGQLAKVRYLVLGSITQLGGLTVNARLVDTRSGLIVQTAKVVAATPDELMKKLPDLARLLMMSDQQQMDYEQELAKQAPLVQPVQVDQPLPAAPEEVQPADQLPPPILVDANQPPPLGGATIEAVQVFRPLVVGQPMPVLVYGGTTEEMWKRRALYVALYLGDDLFRRGRHREAMRLYSFGQSIGPAFVDMDLRISRTRPFLPPVVVVVDPLPPPPRVAVIDFVIAGNPAVVPPHLRWWAPQTLSPYFWPNYQVVDRGELYWWMSRMGMSVNDLLTDPYARRWLGRALNIRYFVFGTVTETASFNVDTFMVDAEYGFLQGRGFVHVNNTFELKYRLGDLAGMTQSAPGLFLQQRQQFASYEVLVGKAQAAIGKGDFVIALGFLSDARKLRPRSIELDIWFQQAEMGRQRSVMEQQRRQEYERQQLAALEQKRRRDELAVMAERQRLVVVQQFAALDNDQRQALERKRLADQQAANNRLVLQARAAQKAGNIQLSVQVYESALALQQSDDIYRELAGARAELNKVKQQRLAEETKLIALKEQRAKEEELTKAKAKIDAEQKVRLVEEAKVRKAQEVRDNGEYQKLFNQGQKELTSTKYSAAISSLQAARRLKKTDDVEKLLNQALLGKARADADAKGGGARKDLDAKLAQEDARRLKAEADAKINDAKYQNLLGLAKKAQASKDYDGAIARFEEAGKIFKTDVVLTGIKQAQTARDQTKAETAQAKEKLLAEQTKQANFQKFMTEGQTAMGAKEFVKAVDKFGSARKLLPDNIDAMTALTKAEQARDRAAVEARAKQEPVTPKVAGDAEKLKKKSAYDVALKDGQNQLNAKKYDDAIKAFQLALSNQPGDATATGLLKQAESARATAVAGDAEKLKKKSAYDVALKEGQNQLNAKKYDDAIKAFQLALSNQPGDAVATGLLKQAESARATTIAGDAEKLKKKSAYDVALKDGQNQLNAKKYDDAIKAFQLALSNQPGDAVATGLLKQAESARATAGAGDAEKLKKKSAYDLALKDGQNQLNAKKYDDAIKAFQLALSNQPGDAVATGLLKQAESARATTIAGDAEKLKKKSAYDVALKDGQNQLNAKKYDDAIKAFQLALSNQPGDAVATGLLKQAQQLRESVIAGGQKQADYSKLMKDGSAALAAKNYSVAVNSFAAAGKLMPGDLAATKALQDANQQWQASKASAELTAAKKAEYGKQMKIGANADTQKKWQEAIKAYDAALTQIPKDGAALSAKNKASYNFHISEGNRFMTAKQGPNAVREFQAALQLFPKDAEATALLKKAQALK